MPEAMVTLRDLCQVTLPAEVVAAVGPETNGSLEVRVVAGSIVLTPTGTAAAPPRSMARFLGAARAAYGGTADEADEIVRRERGSW
jgi:hypothetical protein